jgi:hypothetical protein
MALRVSTSGRIASAGLAVAAAIALAGCSSQDASGGAGSGGDATSGGQPGAGGSSDTGGQPGSGGTNAGGGGAPGQTGGAPTGGTGGQSGEGGAFGGAGGGGGSGSFECTRDALDKLVDDYFTALAAGDPSTLPLAPNVKFTENAEVTQIGSTDFWKNAGEAKHTQRALDTMACSVAVQAVVPEGNTDLPIGLRIEVEGGLMTEIETIVVRQGDYTASYAVASNPAAIISKAAEIGWHDEVPEGQRASREELAGWIDKYFRAFPNGVCNVSPSCRRLENGGGDFSCGTGASCSANLPTQSAMIPRVIIVDEVRGITAGFTIFDFMADGHLDMHMAKMSGGQVHAVHALLRDTDGKSGWE